MTATTKASKHDRQAQIGQLVRTGIVSASLLRPVIEVVSANWRRNNPPAAAAKAGHAMKNTVDTVRGKLEDQLPLTQAQFEHLTKAVAERLEEVTSHTRHIADTVGAYPAKVDKRVWWASGIVVGFVAAGVTAFVITRRRLAAPVVDEFVELAANTNGHTTDSSQDRPRGNVNRPTHSNHAGSDAYFTHAPTAAATATDAALLASAQYIGNINTMIYHPKNSANLPAEVNRVPFPSREAAEAAGYRPASGE